MLTDPLCILYTARVVKAVLVASPSVWN